MVRTCPAMKDRSMSSLPELRRSTSDAKVAGVCAMLANRWQVDPVLVRMAAVLLALSSGIGLVLYAAAWLAIPPAGTDRAPLDSVVPGARRLGRTAWVVVLVIACIITAALLGNLVPFGIGPAVVIAAVWFFGFYRPRQRHRASAGASHPALGRRPFAASTPFTEAAAAWQTRVQAYLKDQGRGSPAPATEVATDPADPGYSLDAYLAHPDPAGLYAEPDPVAPAAQPAPTAQPAPATSPRQRRRTGRMHVIGWSLTVASLITVGALDSAYAVPFVAYPAAMLLALGMTFIIGTWLPRPRGLFMAALVLTLITGFSAMSPGLPQGEVQTVSYSTTSELPAQPVVHEVGTLRADLSGLDLDRDATFAATVDAGRLTIIVPPEVNVRVDWEANAGQVRVLGLHREGGIDMAASTFSPGSDPDGPTLTIEARLSLGTLEVQR